MEFVYKTSIEYLKKNIKRIKHDVYNCVKLPYKQSVNTIVSYTYTIHNNFLYEINDKYISDNKINCS